MIIQKEELLKKVCYTNLVYYRINKKLNTELSNSEIEGLIQQLIIGSDVADFTLIGKNIYIKNHVQQIRITVNFNTNRIITVERMTP